MQISQLNELPDLTVSDYKKFKCESAMESRYATNGNDYVPTSKLKV